MSLVGDAHAGAFSRLDVDYNFAGYPSMFFDGGYRVRAGTTDFNTVYRNMIEECGQREVAPLDLVVSVEWLGDGMIEVDVAVSNGIAENESPAGPSIISSPTVGETGVAYDFEASTTDPDGDELHYMWDWGSGQMSEWIGPYISGQTCMVSNSWPDAGDYNVKVRARDQWENLSEWSATTSVSISTISCCDGSTGNVDSDQDDTVDLGDLTVLIDYLFITFTEPACLQEANVDGDLSGTVDIGDLTSLIDYLFITFTPPAACL